MRQAWRRSYTSACPVTATCLANRNTLQVDAPNLATNRLQPSLAVEADLP